MNLLILGAGGFAREVTDLAEGWDVVGYAVDVSGQPTELLGRPVWQLENARALASMCQVVAAIVSPARWKIIKSARDMGFGFARIVHPSASVSRTVKFFGHGQIVNRNVAVGRDAIVSAHVILNRGCTVGHDCYLGIGATIGPGAHLAGNARVFEWATVGMGACVLEGRTIGERAVVGAGSVVTRDVPAGETWWGAPAKKMR